MKVGKIIIICLVLFLLSLGLGFFAIDRVLSGPVSPEGTVDSSKNNQAGKNSNNNQSGEAKKQAVLTKRINILLVGIDSGEFPGGGVRREKGRTDTIIFAQLDPEKKKIHALSIPRDTLAEIPGRGWDRINHAYAFGDMELTIKTIENFTKLTIDKYVKLDYQGFAYLIDAVGGVEIYVEKNIQSGNYLIEEGLQLLDGEHAYALIRHRKEPMGDIARVARQQQLAKSLFQQIREKQNLLEITLIALKLKEHITTNLTVKDIVLMIETVKGFSEQDIDLATVPGTFYEFKGISYWKPKEKETGELIKSIFVSQ